MNNWSQQLIPGLHWIEMVLNVDKTVFITFWSSCGVPKEI